MNINGLHRVLLVEDDESIREVTGIALRDAGFDVLEACSADDAAPLLDDPDHVDILVTDIRMPGRLDGLDLAMKVRSLNPTMPVLVMSGYAPLLHERLNALAPPHLFLGKPFRLDMMVTTVQGMAAGL